MKEQSELNTYINELLVKLYWKSNEISKEHEQSAQESGGDYLDLSCIHRPGYETGSSGK